MASLVATAAAPLVVAPIQRLIELASDATIGAFWEEIKLIRGVKQEKERLVSMLQTIGTVLAEKNHPKQALVQRWHEKLSELVYDAEDVLDEFATEAELLSRRNKYSPQNLVRKLRSKHDFARQLKSIRKKLEYINDDYKKLGIQKTINIGQPRVHPPQDGNNIHVYQPRQTTTGYTPFKGKLVPRAEQKERIMSWLSDTVVEDQGGIEVKNGGDMNVSFFSVTGMGGIGKTTLAQSVYRDSRVEQSFQVKMWVCVSNDFNITRITKDMMAYFDPSGYHNVENLDALQRGLEAKLEGKRTLLVLDDVWDLTPNWKIMLNPLRGVTKGSKVLVTTRDKKIATEMAESSEKNILHLKGLSEEDVVFILKNKAFANKNMDGGGMERLCEEISKKLGGSPLAATTVGSLLNVNFDREYWKCIATSDEIGRLQEKDEHGIMSILGLSYKRLPPHLKECFAYCSVFPKDYRFSRQELILYWMAQGLVKPGDPQMQSLEWWGNKHFDDLLSLSLFEHYEGPLWEINKDSYGMHDLIHDLAVSVSQDHCDVVKGCQGIRNSEKIRHLSWDVDSPGDLLGCNSVHILNKCERLRTLRLECSFMSENQHSPISHLDSFLDNVVCKKLRRLRCLWLNWGVKRLPASISNLKHLRFLYLRWLDVQELPESLGDLCNLQTLIIDLLSHVGEVSRAGGGSN